MKDETHHVAALDGLRGLAILAVLLSHGVDKFQVVPQHMRGQRWGDVVWCVLQPGWGGVDLFFVLSGFLITGILLRTRKDETYFSSFYARRTLRIFPIYYLYLVVTSIVAHMAGVRQPYIPLTFKEQASYFIYLQNWAVFWPDWNGMRTIWGVFWSLAVEEQFYLVWPTLMRLLNSGTMFAICIAGFLLGTPIRWLMFHHYGIMFGVMQSPFARLDGLFLGAAIALYRFRHGRPMPLLWAIVAGATGTAIYLWVAALHTEELFGQGVHMWTYYVTAFALLSGSVLVMVEHRIEIVQRCLSWRPLCMAGRISYGLYVYHLVIFYVMGLLWTQKIAPHRPASLLPIWAAIYAGMGLAIATAVAAASYRWIETPILKYKRFFPSRAPAL